MDNKITFKDILPTAIEVEVEPTNEILEQESLTKINEGFGKGTTKRKMLVTKGMSLKDLVKAIDD